MEQPQNNRRKTASAKPKSGKAPKAVSSHTNGKVKRLGRPTKTRARSKIKDRPLEVDPSEITESLDDFNESAAADSDSDSPPSLPLPEAIPNGEGIIELETLLDCPNRKPLPQLVQRAGPKCKLHEIILHAPDLYAKLIMCLRVGNSPNVAAERCGIHERAFYSWAQRGARDAELEPPVDSYYSRFFYDVRRAIAVKAGECEEIIAAKNPTKWLSQGPGRMFGNKWGKDPNKTSLPAPGHHGAVGINGTNGQLPSPDETLDGTFQVIHNPHSIPLDPVEEEQLFDAQGNPIPNAAPLRQQLTGPSSNGRPGATLPVSKQQEYEALKIWEGIELVTISDSLKQAYEDQISTEQGTQPKTQVEDEDD